MDWRIGPLREILRAIDAWLERVNDRLAGADTFRVDIELDNAEALMGTAFIVTQTYLEGTVGDIARELASQQGRGKQSTAQMRRECYRYDACLAPSGIPRVQLIDAVANYFKHHESVRGLDEPVRVTLKQAGIGRATEYPCVAAARLLLGDSPTVSPLAGIVYGWRKRLVADMACPERRK